MKKEDVSLVVKRKDGSRLRRRSSNRSNLGSFQNRLLVDKKFRRRWKLTSSKIPISFLLQEFFISGVPVKFESMGAIISKASSLGLDLYGRQQHAASRSASPSHEFENNAEQKNFNIDAVEDDVADRNSPAVYDTYPDEDDNPVSNEVAVQLKRDGLESAKVIVGFDFTKSNERTGARSFNGKSLHFMGAVQNPYEQAVSIIGKALHSFDMDRMIPCFGFGDATTNDQEVFSFYPDESACCYGFEQVIKRYGQVVPKLQLGGPKSFAPIIEMAITVVEQSGGQYHVLVIIADGQVTRGDDTEVGQLSPQEKKTIEAIMKASEYPLSIILVGVGDGPWDMMKEFERAIPPRAFDNFQFVNASDILSKNMDSSRKEVEFASAALMKLPSQYKAIQELNILGATRENAVGWMPLPPPRYDSASVGNYAAPHAHVCPICLTDPKDMAFGCGHQTCCDCGQDLQICPICRDAINMKIKLY